MFHNLGRRRVCAIIGTPSSSPISCQEGPRAHVADVRLVIGPTAGDRFSPKIQAIRGLGLNCYWT